MLKQAAASIPCIKTVYLKKNNFQMEKKRVLFYVDFNQRQALIRSQIPHSPIPKNQMLQTCIPDRESNPLAANVNVLCHIRSTGKGARVSMSKFKLQLLQVPFKWEIW